MASMIHACVQFGDDSAIRRLRVLAGTARLYPVLQRLGSQFSAATGIPLYFNFSTRVGSTGTIMRAAIAAPPPVLDTDDASGGLDAIIASPAFMSLMDQGGKLLDLGKLVESDLQLKWFEVDSMLRNQMVVYGNKVVAIPVTTAPSFLFYHAPTFARDGLQVPATWDAVLALAEEYNGKDFNGDGKPDYGICITAPNCFVDGTFFQGVLASFVQTQGPGQGLFLDPATMANLANTTAMAEALEVMRRIRLAGPRFGDCSVFEDAEYLRGNCLLSITTPITFKTAYSPDAPPAYAAMRGHMGMAAYPGSTRVLDRPTGRMVDCDETTCPLARVKARDTNGVLRPVNQPVPSNNVIVMINAQSPPKYQFYAYSLFSYLTSPQVLGSEGDALLLDPRLETAPLRGSDLTPESAALWVDRGYHPSDVKHFFEAYRAALGNPNQAYEPRFAGNLNISTASTLAIVMYANTTPGYQPPPVSVPVAMIARSVAAVVAANGGPAAFAASYRQTLNWAPPPAPPPAPAPYAIQGDRGHNRVLLIALTVALPCASVLLVVLAVVTILLHVRNRARHRVAEPPGAGPDTTILVTDIQSSTSLWEHLANDVMDDALSVHHAVIRKAIADWGGYECLTEGDSFIVAFPDPTSALGCALAAQQALLSAPWPPGLLAAPPLPGLEGDEQPLAELAALPANRQVKGLGRHASGAGARWTKLSMPNALLREPAGLELAPAPPEDPHLPLPPEPAAKPQSPSRGCSACLAWMLPACCANGRSGKAAASSDGAWANYSDGAAATQDRSAHLRARVAARTGSGAATATQRREQPQQQQGQDEGQLQHPRQLDAPRNTRQFAFEEVGEGAPQPSNESGSAGSQLDSGGGAAVSCSGSSFRTASEAPLGTFATRLSRNALTSEALFAPTAASNAPYTGCAGDGNGLGASTLAAALRASFRIVYGAGTGELHRSHHLATQAQTLRNDNLDLSTSPNNAQPPSVLPADTVALFRGLRVRMGMWTGVGSAADINVNARNRRTQYSGDCLRYAKAVADTAHGGMVGLTEVSRARLDPNAVRSSKHVLLYGGLHAVDISGPVGAPAEPPRQLHLYMAYSSSLLPRAIVLRPLRSAGELRPGVLSAPVGHGTVVQMRVVGAELLLAWNATVAAAALEQLHETALSLLRAPTMSSCDVSGGGISSVPFIAAGHASLLPSQLPPQFVVGAGGRGAATSAPGPGPGCMTVVFPDAECGVSWAAAVRRAGLELSWPPQLLEQELAEEVWAFAPCSAGIGDASTTAHDQHSHQQPATTAPGPSDAANTSINSAPQPRFTTGRSRKFDSFTAAARRTRFGGAGSALHPSPGTGTSVSFRASQSPSATAGILAGVSVSRLVSRLRLDQQASREALSASRSKRQHVLSLPMSGTSGAVYTPAGADGGMAAQGKPPVQRVRSGPARPLAGGVSARQEAGSTSPGVHLTLANGMGTGPRASATTDSGAEAGSSPCSPVSPSLPDGDILVGGAPTDALEGSVGGKSEQRDSSPLPFGRISSVVPQSAVRTSQASVPPSPPATRSASATLLPPAQAPASQPPTALLPSPSVSLRAASSILPSSRGASAPRAASPPRPMSGGWDWTPPVPSGISSRLFGAGSNAAGLSRRMPNVSRRSTGGMDAPECGAEMRLLYRGLRLRFGVAAGPLKGGLAAGDVSGQVSYGGKAALAAAKLAAKAKAGQICATAKLAHTLPTALASELTIVEKTRGRAAGIVPVAEN